MYYNPSKARGQLQVVSQFETTHSRDYWLPSDVPRNAATGILRELDAGQRYPHELPLPLPPLEPQVTRGSRRSDLL